VEIVMRLISTPSFVSSASLRVSLAALAGLALTLPCAGQAVSGDIVVGWSRSSVTDTIRLYDAAGQQKPDQWNAFGFVQSITWDNTGGLPQNPNGNLVGLNFGTTAAGGSVYIYRSGAQGWSGVEVLGAGPSAQFTFATVPPAGLLLTRIAGVSVSPDNARIAFTGNDSSRIAVLDYDAAGMTITGARETTGFPLPIVGGVSTGTAWLDNNKVLALSASGDLVQVETTPGSGMSWSVLVTVPGANLGGSQFTSLAYVPSVSDYIYAAYSQFDAVQQVRTNKLHVIETQGWQVVRTIDLSISADTMREIALDGDGNLIFTTFGGIIQKLSDVRNPATLSDNSSVTIGTFGASVSFSGVSVAIGEGTPACYANCDGSTIPPVLNVDDFTCFINQYASAQTLPAAQQVTSYANCDGSTIQPVLNVDDFTCFINRYASGCR
jgi:hypothetical protein